MMAYMLITAILLACILVATGCNRESWALSRLSDDRFSSGMSHICVRMRDVPVSR